LEHDATNPELVNTVFRAFHTIKGVAGFIHLTPIVRLAHRAEQLLDGARSGTIRLARTELDLILAACDMLLKLLAMVEGGAAPERGDFNRLVRALDIASVVPASGAGAAPALEPEPEAAPAPPHVRAEPADMLAPLPTA